MRGTVQNRVNTVMRALGSFIGPVGVVILCLMLTSTANAQPGPGQLADRLAQKSSEYLSDIETMSVTIEMMGFVHTTDYKKVIRDGTAHLVQVDDEEETEMWMGSYDDRLFELVEGARSITSESLDQTPVYKVIIDDRNLLTNIMNPGEHTDLQETMNGEVKSLTLWLDQDDLLARKIFLEQEQENGMELAVELLMDDYQIHSGFPMAHEIAFRVEGLNSQFSEAELRQAKKDMQELQEQLEKLPESQRKMIEQQLKPQIEKFRNILESEEGFENMTIRVREVRVNE